jgi:RND family efflux transporter MFP subunit
MCSLAQLEGASGDYRVRLRTDPPVVPIGQAQLTLELLDRANAPVSGAQVRVLVRMPNMNMGEKETSAEASGKPGVYHTPASFMMAGAYEAGITIDGPKGRAQIRIPIHTGQDTSARPGSRRAAQALAVLAALALAIFTLWRMHRTNQRIRWSLLASRGTLAGIGLLAVVGGTVIYAVQNWRRPGAMTPIEAQAMEMHTPPPPGHAYVTLATVERGPVETSVTYTGQSVPFNEQVITSRTEGWLLWMPFYPGDSVRQGQVVARLDTSSLDPKVTGTRAAERMARADAETARNDTRAAEADLRKASSAADARRSALEAQQAEAEAARLAIEEAEAARTAASQRTAQARAAMDSVRAALDYRRAQLTRTRELHARGAVSTEELQREQSEAAASEAAYRDAAARVSEALSGERSAEVSAERAKSLHAVAIRRREQALAELRMSEQELQAARAAVNAAYARTQAASAAIEQSRAAVQGTLVQRQYAEVRALQAGVVTERVAGPGSLILPGQPILRVAQIQTIRLQANVAAPDLARIRLGAPIEASLPGSSLPPIRGRVTAIVPTVDAVARTGIVEASVPNQGRLILPGQNITLRIVLDRRADQLRIPSSAVLSEIVPGTGPTSTRERHYVWVAEPSMDGSDSFRVKRAVVRLASDDGEYASVVDGLTVGQKVVASGHRSLRPGDTVRDVLEEARRDAVPAATEATIEVSSAGFRPERVRLKAGRLCRLTFLRKDEQNCGDELLIPSVGIRRKLPVGQPVTIEFTPTAGEIAFTCGMQMLRGKVVAE